VSTHRTTFEQSALASGLLSQEQIDRARASLQASHDYFGSLAVIDDQRLADKLVEMGQLNLWQATQLLAGRTKFNLGPYWIIDSLGSGGMGQVFKAEHGVLRRVVAVKVLPRSKSTPEAIASFTREVRAQARLDHPNLVRAFDAGEDGKVFYLVTEYVPGTDLRKLVRANGPLSMQAAASIISQVALGLQHAHENGLIHRDVKPGNVLVTPQGHAKLSDLGLAGPLEPDAEEADPRLGKIVGTADYLSPDHIKSPWQPAPAWDIYSLGCTLYYTTTGKVPFPGGTTADKARAHCQLRPLDPRRLNPQLSPEFVELIAGMMAKDPAERTRTAAEVAVRLAPWVGAASAGTIPISSLGLSMAVPPRSESAESGSLDPEAHLQDTQPSFPELPEAAPGHPDDPSQSSQATRPVASSDEDTVSQLGLPRLDNDEPTPIMGPLAVLILFPLGLVGIILLACWLAKLL
jgi:eukaryotic-like serine/threonine-protein kinase